MAYLQLNYHVNEIRYGDTVKSIDNEEWVIGNVENEYGEERFLIRYSNGDISPTGFIFVNNDTHVGLQFDTDSYFPLGKYGYPEEFVKISTVAIVRQPYNVWLWAYLIDENGNNVATFCGYDDLDGLARFVEELKEEYGE